MDAAKPCPICFSTDLHVGLICFGVFGVRCRSCGLKMERTIDAGSSIATVAEAEQIALEQALGSWNARIEEDDPNEFHLYDTITTMRATIRAQHMEKALHIATSSLRKALESVTNEAREDDGIVFVPKISTRPA